MRRFFDRSFSLAPCLPVAISSQFHGLGTLETPTLRVLGSPSEVLARILPATLRTRAAERRACIADSCNLRSDSRTHSLQSAPSPSDAEALSVDWRVNQAQSRASLL